METPKAEIPKNYDRIMTLQSPEPFQREYFDWSEEEFAQRFVEKISAGRLRQNEAYIDLKIEKKSSARRR